MSGADRIACVVSDLDRTPYLSLPKGERSDSIPEGWVDVLVDGEPYQAEFANHDIRVLHRGDEEENILPRLLRGWFGAGAGGADASPVVEFVRSGGVYVLAPSSGELLEKPVLWTEYKRAEVPRLLGFAFKGREDQIGIVERPGLMVLFVTLVKDAHPVEHRYQEEFTSASEFQWQSQRRTRAASAVAERIRNHEGLGVNVHLFVRTYGKIRGVTQPFRYCGELQYVREEGEKPITVWWTLRSSVPAHLHAPLRVPERR